MPVIKIPNIFKVYWVEHNDEAPPALVDGYVEYTVTEDMKKFWDSLSEREQETLCSNSQREHKDLREVLAKQM